ncbi:MAG: hypothetical protein U0350_48195 [Caldilineaceae bacterium]
MKIKIGLSVGLAILTLTLFTIIATAQQTTSTPNSTPVAQLQPLNAVIAQQVPVSLTLRIPGATGVQTVTIPVVLSLNIQVGLARPISPAIGVSVVAIQPKGPATPTVSLATATPTALPVATNTPPAPTSTPVVTATITATPTKAAVVAPQCPSPGSVITAPGVNQVVSGTVTLKGTAEGANFDYYKLEYAVGANASEAVEYRYFAGGATAVHNGPLGAFDSRALPNRAYTLRLTVVDKTGNYPQPCQVTVLVQN